MRKAGELKNWQRRGRRLLPWLLSAALLACGGGTKQIEPFQPRQVIMIGDETVGLLPDGRRYGINGLDANASLECDALALWSQQLVGSYGFGTDYCGAGVGGVTRAVANGKAADLDAQISAQIAVGVTSKDLFVVMVGMNDIIEVYETYVQGAGDRYCDSGNGNPPAGTMQAELAARGHLAAVQISRILAADGRAIVSTVHDIGQTPYARAKGDMTLLSCMTAVYNTRVRVDIRPFDGRLWGLVLADDNTTAIVRNPASYGLTNITDGACTVAPPDCTTATLVTGAGTSNYLWADDRHFAPLLHNQLANQAITRARGNPF